MTESRGDGPAADDGATVAALRRLLRVFRESPVPAPARGDEELIAEVREASDARRHADRPRRSS